jgi:hypothetical protein
MISTLVGRSSSRRRMRGPAGSMGPNASRTRGPSAIATVAAAACALLAVAGGALSAPAAGASAKAPVARHGSAKKSTGNVASYALPVGETFSWILPLENQANYEDWDSNM